MDLARSDAYEGLINAGLRFVSYRPRSEKEIRDFLAKKLTRSHTTAPKILIQVMERLTELGYVNDDKFAAWWIEQRTGRKPKGKKFIERELQQKGVTQEVWIEEKTLARRAIEKKLPVWKNLSIHEQKKKISEYLFRRGFNWDAIGSVVDEALRKE